MSEAVVRWGLIGCGDIAEKRVAPALREAPGKHVLCEKPMALNVAECERMIGAARQHGVRLGIAYYRHLYPALRRLRELLSSGELGKPVFAQVQAFEHFDPQPGHPRAWLLRKAESGGGPMMDFGCHRIEILLDLFGAVQDVRGFPTKVRYRRRRGLAGGRAPAAGEPASADRGGLRDCRARESSTRRHGRDRPRGEPHAGRRLRVGAMFNIRFALRYE